MEIDFKKEYKKTDLVLTNKIEGSAVLHNSKNDTVYGVNTVAVLIWEYLETPITPNEIISNLLKEFDVSKEDCTEETKLFLIELLEEQMICINE